MNIEVRGSENIHFTEEAFPTEATQQILPDEWYIVETLSGGTVGRILNIISTFIPLERSIVSHSSESSGSTGNRYSYKIEIDRNLFDTIDYEEPLKRSVKTHEKNGGLHAFFPYIKYDSNSATISTVTSVQYGVSALPYFDGYVQVGAMTTRYNLD